MIRLNQPVMPTTNCLRKSQLVASPVAKSQEWSRNKQSCDHITGWTSGHEVAWLTHHQSYDIDHPQSCKTAGEWSCNRRTTIQDLCATACDLWSLQQVFWTCSATYLRLILIVRLHTVAETSCTILLRLSATCTLTRSYIGCNVVAWQMWLSSECST